MVVQEPTYLPIGESRSDQSKSLPKLLETYLQYHRVEGSTKATLRHKTMQLGLFIRWLSEQGHSLFAEDVTRMDVVGHLAHLKDLERRPDTIKTRYRCIKAWANWMKDWGLIERPFTEGMKTPRVPTVYKAFLSKEQFEAMMALCPSNTYLGSRRAAMLKLFITSGVRREELTNLKLSDLDWDGETVRVLGKGQKERTVPFVRPDCQRLMLRYLRNRKARFDDHRGELWLTEEGGPLGYAGVGNEIKRLMDKAGIDIPDFCHALRRTWAKGSLERGMLSVDIRAKAGWTSNRMLEHYTKAMELDESAANEAYRGFDPFGP